MRKLLILLLFVNYTVAAQFKIKDSVVVYYEEVVETEKSKREVHDAVEEFLAISSKNSNHTIKINNEDQILTKGNINVDGSNSIDVVLNAEFKEGRYKILMDHISWDDRNILEAIMHYDKDRAKRNIREMYIENGMKKDYDIKEKKGEIDSDMERMVEEMNMLYDKSKEEILAFINSLKEYIENNKNSDW